MVELVYERVLKSRFVVVPEEAAGGRGVNVDPTLVAAGFYWSRLQTFSPKCRV
ncbi:hypothetical protein F2Q70_00044174 [Brassica cretica]|uniref:Uncharacterized protein n=1 Tax=Brassica cretica TaxID=69181 RepID=A0A8S9KGH9_BRACR|nr:hypothetical protein F2Q70_00044174 [Brassica cretica]